MEKSAQTNSFHKVFATCFGLGLLMFLTSLATLLYVHNFATPVCPATADLTVPQQTAPVSKDGEWDAVERLNIEEKGVTVVRALGRNRCYIRPYVEGKSDKPLIMVPGALSDHLVEQIGGPWAMQFCEGMDTYLLRDLGEVEHSRRRRQADQSGGAGQQQGPTTAGPLQAGGAPGQAPGQGQAGGAQGGNGGATQRPFGTSRRPSGLDLDIDQRNPRCDELILDCVISVGKVQTCYTWINGVIKMAQTCESPTVFKVFMTKPPGRMLKIAQEQWKICVERRKTGLKC